MAELPLSRGRVLRGWWGKGPGSRGSPSTRVCILAQLGAWGEALKLPRACFLSAKQMYSRPLSRVVVTSAGHCAGLNSHVFTPVILATALRSGNYSYPHFPDGGTEAQQLAQCHLASGREGTA